MTTTCAIYRLIDIRPLTYCDGNGKLWHPRHSLTYRRLNDLFYAENSRLVREGTKEEIKSALRTLEQNP